MYKRAVATAAATLLLLSIVGCQQETPKPDPVSSLPAGPVGDSEADAVLSRATVSEDGSTFTAAGYVSGISEDGGTCTFVFRLGDDSLELTSTGLLDASTTSCPEVTGSVSDLFTGVWDVVLDYSSDDVSLSSEPFTLEIP